MIIVRDILIVAVALISLASCGKPNRYVCRVTSYAAATATWRDTSYVDTISSSYIYSNGEVINGVSETREILASSVPSQMRFDF